MDVASICSRHIVSVDSRQPLQSAALLMRDHHVGSVVVTRINAEGQQVLGLVTDRDLAIEVQARGGKAAEATVGQLVQAPPVMVDAQASLEQAVQVMHDAGVRRLLVHDSSGHLIGVLSMDDLLPALTAPLHLLADALKQGMTREAAQRGHLRAVSQPPLRVPSMGTVGWQLGSGGTAGLGPGQPQPR